MLAACVSSLAGVVDHLVAVDGAYLLYPEAKPSSEPQQARLIEEICRGLRIGYTIHVPSDVWAGNEVQKRNHAVRLADLVTRDDGWYFAVDADCVVTKVAFDWFDKLMGPEVADFAAATVNVKEVREVPGFRTSPNDGFSPVRLLYRALKDVTYGPTHWSIAGLDDEDKIVVLWGDGSDGPCEAFDAGYLLELEHRKERPQYRDVAARQYYDRRDKFGIERPQR